MYTMLIYVINIFKSLFNKNLQFVIFLLKSLIMATGKHTTVILTENSQIIKNTFTPIYGLKNILSAGLVLFNELPQEKREQCIAKANGIIDHNEANTKKTDPKLGPFFEALAEMLDTGSPGLRIHSKEAMKQLNELRKEFEGSAGEKVPDEKKKKA